MAKEHTSAKSSRNDADEPETGTEVEQEERQAEQIYQTVSVTPEGGLQKGVNKVHYTCPGSTEGTAVLYVVCE